MQPSQLNPAPILSEPGISESPNDSSDTWLEVIPFESRRRALIWHAGIGISIGIALWIFPANHWTIAWDRFWLGLVSVTIGLLSGVNRFRTKEVRRYGTQRISYSKRQRLLRARGWWAFACVLLAGVWGVEIYTGHFLEYWPIAWPCAIPALIGLGLYRLRGETVITPAGDAAKAHIEAARVHQVQQRPKAGAPSKADDNKIPWWARYAFGAGLIALAIFMESRPGNSGDLAAVVVLIFAALLMYEILLALLLGGIAWAFLGALAGIPTGAAIIIGSLIIANSKKR